MEDIAHALYQMDFSKIELESLWGLYEIRGKKEELEKINTHVQTHEDGEYINFILRLIWLISVLQQNKVFKSFSADINYIRGFLYAMYSSESPGSATRPDLFNKILFCCLFS